MRIPNPIKQVDARVNLCDALNGLRAIGLKTGLNVSVPANVIKALAGIGVKIRWDTGSNRFKARG